MNNADFKLNFPIQVLEYRVTIALSKLGLNEFYASFKYLREILIHIITTRNYENCNIRNYLNVIEEKHNITKRTLLNSFTKIFKMCPNFVFSNLNKNKNINFCVKIKILCEYVLNEIKKQNMAE